MIDTVENQFLEIHGYVANANVTSCICFFRWTIFEGVLTKKLYAGSAYERAILGEGF